MQFWFLCAVVEGRGDFAPQAFTKDRASDVVFLCPTANQIFWEKANFSAEVIDDSFPRASLVGNRIFIHSLMVNDSGLYRCRNESGHTVKQFSLTVLESSLYAKESVVYVTEGGSISITCIRHARDVSVLWYYNDEIVPTRGRFTKLEIGNLNILKIENVQRSDNGKYKCKANLKNSFIENSTVVHVGIQPEIRLPFASITTLVGGQVLVVCNFTADLPYNVSWLANESSFLISDSATLNISNVEK
eukprot:m.183391 g.183391  ORF g.183391 m.183391 type:complete len:246 (+) comp39304_c0_seq107:59-796(+)